MPEPSEAIQPCPLKKEKEQPQEPQLHWIKFNLQDDKGKPMGGVKLNIVLPDGSIEEKVSNDLGVIEIKNIQPGNCKIDSDWKEYTVHETVFIQK